MNSLSGFEKKFLFTRMPVITADNKNETSRTIELSVNPYEFPFFLEIECKNKKITLLQGKENDKKFLDDCYLVENFMEKLKLKSSLLERLA